MQDERGGPLMAAALQHGDKAQPSGQPMRSPFHGGVTPISAVTWSWRALRGHSVTFAVLLASAVLGISILGAFRHLLTRLGAPWYVWIIVPILAVGYFAKKEQEWIPEPERRRWWARRVLIGGIVLAVLFGGLKSRHNRVRVEGATVSPAVPAQR